MADVMWIWGILGLTLLAAEMATGTVYLLWFGVSALCMLLTVWLMPTLSYSVQFLMFAVLSISTLAIWKLNYKKTETHSRLGQAQGEEIGRIGTLSKACGPQQNGSIQFTQGVMGSREWPAISDEVIEPGQTAKVIAVEGNALRVTAHI